MFFNPRIEQGKWKSGAVCKGAGIELYVEHAV